LARAKVFNIADNQYIANLTSDVLTKNRQFLARFGPVLARFWPGKTLIWPGKIRPRPGAFRHARRSPLLVLSPWVFFAVVGVVTNNLRVPG